MSHIVTVKTEIRDPTALRSACQRLKLVAPVHETVRLFTTQATGWAVRLRDWRYPVVCHTDTRRITPTWFGARNRHLPHFIGPIRPCTPFVSALISDPDLQ